MKDLDLLLQKMKVEHEPSDERFRFVIDETAKFYIENFNLNEDEVAIFLASKDRSVLSFAYPKYLVDAGMIPVSSIDAVASDIFRTGETLVENNFTQLKHLTIFESIRTPEKKIKPIWKVLGTVISAGKDKIGVIELSRRGVVIQDVGKDFTMVDADFLEKSIARIAIFIKQIMPENFRSRLV